MTATRFLVVASLAACGTSIAEPPAQAPASAPVAADHVARVHDIYKQLVELDTTDQHGDTLVAARAMGDRLLAAGFPEADVHVLEAAPKRGDLVARLRGTGKRKPLLLMAHLDVVEAKREDWSTDPFQLVERDGWYYGRGTGDDKYMAAAWVANMIRWKQEGYRPDRDLILVLETDEEISDRHHYGINGLIANHRDLIDAEYGLNEGGSVAAHADKPVWNSIQTAEKLYATYSLEVKNRGGHSSQPRADNAIYSLARALTKVERYAFPIELNDTTRGYFTAMATIETGQLATDLKSIVSAHPDDASIARLSALPPYNAQLRTTCVATEVGGGHAENALPQLARATVNCRILPGHDADETLRTLVGVIEDPDVAVTIANKDDPSTPSAMNPELYAAVKRLTAKFWPGIPVIPTMSAGATDGRYLRMAGIPVYGHSGLVSDLFDVRAHGKDERVSSKAFDEGVEYLYELVRILAGGR
jgi:acetylornithine deacetylase/succinyl-diaminopimelate desuccinylase-like protein